MPNQNLMTPAEVYERVRLQRTAVWTLVKRGEFPQPVRYGPRCNRWLESEVDGWINERVAERELAAA